MKKHDRVGAPLAGLTLAAILLASMAGYVSALSRIFEGPDLSEQSESTLAVDDRFDVRVEEARGAGPEQALARVAPAWLLNALPAYSSGRAREAWYFALDRAGDRIGFEMGGNVTTSASAGYILFNPAQFSSSPGVVGAGSPKISTTTLAALGTTNNYTGTTTGSVLTAGNWSLGHVPTVSEDAVFPVGATTGIRTFSNGSLTVGSWDVLATTGTFTLRNATNNTTSTLTLGGPGELGNGVSGTAADLLFAASGSTFTITGTNGTLAILNVVLGQSGNFDAAGTINVSAVISDGGGGFGITKSGAGTLTLSGANTYSGGLTLSTGALNINNAAAPGTGTFTINGGTIANTSGAAITLTNNNAQTWGGDFTVSVSGSGGTGDLNLGTGAVLLTGNRQILNISGSSTFTVGGVISDGGNGYSLTRAGSGAGIWVLTGNSTYSGGTTLGSGTNVVSSIGNAGASGNLGTGNISLGNGSTTATLLYTGAGETTNKVFNLNGTTGGGIIDTTGATGGLILSTDFTATGAGTKTLTLRGDTAGNTVSGAIVDNLTGTNNTNLSKTGIGTWTLSGANTYTGTTTVSGGTLAINNNNTTTPRLAGTSSVTVNSGGTLLLAQSGEGSSIDRIKDTAGMTLNANGSTAVAFNTGGLSEHGANNNTAGIGALTLLSSSIIDLSNGASILAFANSSAQTWTGTLSIYNWSGTQITGNGTDQVYFGMDPTGLTVAQLNSINFYSDSGTTLLGTAMFAPDLDGEIVPTLVPVPEPGTWIGAALALLAVGLTQRKRLKRSRN